MTSWTRLLMRSSKRIPETFLFLIFLNTIHCPWTKGALYRNEHEKQKESKIRYDRRRRVIFDNLGDICDICGKKIDIDEDWETHRKDGNPHRRLESMNELNFVSELGTKCYMLLHLRCHKRLTKKMTKFPSVPYDVLKMMVQEDARNPPSTTIYNMQHKKEQAVLMKTYMKDRCMKRRVIILSEFGDTCDLCGKLINPNDKWECHRKDGKPHRSLELLSEKKFKESLISGEYINYHTRCHKILTKNPKFSYAKIQAKCRLAQAKH